jgi:hypothetical protein
MHMPKPFWQPLDDMQWFMLIPHHPYCEQHVPNMDPVHVKPLAPAQVPSVDAFLAVAAAEVAAGLVEETAAGLTEETAAGLTEVAAPVPEQVPKAALQPVEQKSVVEPHQPYWEQQLPNVEPLHVKPEAPPHEPSVETLPAGTTDGVAALEVVGAAALVVVGTAPLEPQLPAPAWQPVPQ